MPKNTSLDRKVLFALFFVTLWGSCAAFAETVSAPGKDDTFSDLKKSFITPKEQVQEAERIEKIQDVAGLEWMQMRVVEKEDQILASMYLLSKCGIPLRKSQNDYYNLVQEKLVADPNLYKIPVTRILSTVVYETEPEAKIVLDELKKKAKIQKIEMH